MNLLDNCVNNYVRGKIYEFQRWIIDEEGDEPLYFPEERTQNVRTMFSDTNITYRLVIMGMSIIRDYQTGDMYL